MAALSRTQEALHHAQAEVSAGGGDYLQAAQIMLRVKLGEGPLAGAIAGHDVHAPGSGGSSAAAANSAANVVAGTATTADCLACGRGRRHGSFPSRAGCSGRAAGGHAGHATNHFYNDGGDDDGRRTCGCGGRGRGGTRGGRASRSQRVRQTAWAVVCTTSRTCQQRGRINRVRETASHNS